MDPRRVPKSPNEELSLEILLDAESHLQRDARGAYTKLRDSIQWRPHHE